MSGGSVRVSDHLAGEGGRLFLDNVETTLKNVITTFIFGGYGTVCNYDTVSLNFPGSIKVSLECVLGFRILGHALNGLILC